MSERVELPTRPDAGSLPPWTLALLAAVGGAFGSAARAAVQAGFESAGWPVWGAHLAVNVVGATTIGVLFARLSARDAHGMPLGIPHGLRRREHLLGAGFLGGFTTVSGFAWDVVDLVQGGDPASASLMIGVNALVGIAACAAGYRLAIHVVPQVSDPDAVR
ncbi:MAG: CrcB family protein [Phycisphaerales bacterium]|nr:CrcB family protein [Phycisphaerales bacterium]